MVSPLSKNQFLVAGGSHGGDLSDAFVVIDEGQILTQRVIDRGDVSFRCAGRAE